MASRDDKLSWRERRTYGAAVVVVIVVVGAAFPRAMSWVVFTPARLGPRGLVVYIAFNTVMDFGMRTWLLPYFRRVAEEQERARAELARTLGREPTEADLVEHFRLTCKR
jgi:hypothetical protein